jgi:L-ascorbate metabolism protein UlaG (beta-lactamase superfamily)
MKFIYSILILSIILAGCQGENNKKQDEAKDNNNAQKEQKTGQKPEIVPIQHATFFMKWGDKNIYVDPVGGKQAFEKFPSPDMVLITDIHGDHLSVETLKSIGQDYRIIAPEAVYDKLPESHKALTTVMKNNERKTLDGFSINAIPMYNTSKSRKQYHVKGRGNGYKIIHDNFSLYISGDTNVTKEMLALKNIDHALLCMNLPYTMDYKHAAKGVLKFQPDVVTPYHYRGKKDGATYYENVEAFEEEVKSVTDKIDVQLMEWYPKKSS